VCVVADVDDDRHPHHVLDVSSSGRRSSCESAHARFALRIAACSDCTNASLVSVAPEMRSTFALCALSASERSVGSAFWLMKIERSVWFGYTGTPIDVMRRVTFLRVPVVTVVFRTTIVTCSVPQRSTCTVEPLNLFVTTFFFGVAFVAAQA